jgi:hypothetical protein
LLLSIPPCKISEPWGNPFWEKSHRGREIERKKERRENKLGLSQDKVGWQARLLSLTYKLFRPLELFTNKIKID